MSSAAAYRPTNRQRAQDDGFERLRGRHLSAMEGREVRMHRGSPEWTVISQAVLPQRGMRLIGFTEQGQRFDVAVANGNCIDVKL